MRAELLVQLLVPALADQVQVEVADRRRERVRVVDGERAAVAVVDREPVAQRRLRALHEALEDTAGVDLLERHDRAVAELRADAVRRGPQRTHNHAPVVRVRPEHGVRVGVLASDERVELTGSDVHSPSSSRRMPATGIATQSGRLSSS
jgi:hypothetical protein